MFVKVSAIFAGLAIIVQVAVATPPACVIAAVNTQEDPTDFKTVCAADDVSKYITDNCGDNLKTANDYITEVCKDNDQEYKGSTASSGNDKDEDVSSSAPSSATNTHSAGGSYATGYATGYATSYANATIPTGVPTPVSSAPATATGAAERTGATIDILGLVALGLLSTMLAL